VLRANRVQQLLAASAFLRHGGGSSGTDRPAGLPSRRVAERAESRGRAHGPFFGGSLGPGGTWAGPGLGWDDPAYEDGDEYYDDYDYDDDGYGDDLGYVDWLFLGASLT
jgi:hypothetical protein